MLSRFFKAVGHMLMKNQNKAMTIEIQKMLQWCLTESLQPDGSFKPHIADGSLRKVFITRHHSLAASGILTSSERFWDSRNFLNRDDQEKDY